MNFRRVFVALAVMALFAGLASAQLQQLAAINCTVAPAQSPVIRSEGVTEKVGDILITCGTSSTAASAGPVTRGNLTINFGAPVTSKAANSVNNVGAASEVLLLINDPGSNNGPVAAYGQNAAMKYCSAVQAQGDYAAEIVGAGSLVADVNCPTRLIQKNNTAGTQSYWELDDGTGVASAANVYQGAIGGNRGNVAGLTGVNWSSSEVKFFNVPIFPAFNSSQSNTFRVVNARVTPGANATITATITPTVLAAAAGGYVVGSTYNYVMNGTPQVASVSSGLTTTMNGVLGVSLCNPANLNPGANQAKANVALLTFKENFSGGFKTAYLPLGAAGTDATGSVGIPAMNNVNESYTVGAATLSAAFAEGGFQTAAIGGVTPGTVNTGTRLQAKFTGLDPNVTYYVSTGPVVDFQNIPTTNGYAGGTFVPGDTKSAGWAVLVTSTTAAYTPVASVANANGVVPVAIVARAADGTGTAVWEVTNTVQGTPQTLTFALYAEYNLNSEATTPTVGNNGTIQLGYAPTTANAGAASTAIPRFAAPGMTAAKFLNILPCQTSLLFPFVTGTQGYNTGIAISNTSADPYGTANSTGKCTLSFYSSTTPATYTTPNNVAPGTAYTALLSGNDISEGETSTELTNFDGVGYMIATCNFQFAHGFAFVAYGSPSTAGYAAMGYTASVISNSPNRGMALSGEQLGM